MVRGERTLSLNVFCARNEQDESLTLLQARCSGHRPGAIDTKAGAKRTGGIFYGNAAVIELDRALTKLAKVLRIDLEAIETTKQLLEVFHDFWLKLDEDRQLVKDGLLPKPPNLRVADDGEKMQRRHV